MNLFILIHLTVETRSKANAELLLQAIAEQIFTGTFTVGCWYRAKKYSRLTLEITNLNRFIDAEDVKPIS